jgi:hypothetical protein
LATTKNAKSPVGGFQSARWPNEICSFVPLSKIDRPREPLDQVPPVAVVFVTMSCVGPMPSASVAANARPATRGLPTSSKVPTGGFGMSRLYPGRLITGGLPYETPSTVSPVIEVAVTPFVASRFVNLT